MCGAETSSAVKGEIGGGINGAYYSNIVIYIVSPVSTDISSLRDVFKPFR